MNIRQIFDLSNKKAIVTGATGAIGFSCAQALCAFGAKLVLVGRNQEKLENIKKALASQFDLSDDALVCECLDFANLSALEKMFLAHGDSSILINSVGINIPQSILEVQEEDYDVIIDSNVKIAFFQTQYFIKTRLSRLDSQSVYSKNKDAANNATSSLVHISSQMGFVGGDKRSVYCASKHAMEGMCKATALEIGKWNMRINTIAPTFINTTLVQSTIADPSMNKLIKDSIVFGRIGNTSDLHGAVLYLASDASSLVTGTSIKVDGGWTAR